MNYKKLFRYSSSTHGTGCFAGESIKKGELIAHWFDDSKLMYSEEVKRTSDDPIVYKSAVKLIGDTYVSALVGAMSLDEA